MEKQESTRPPEAVRNAARRGLELRRRYNRGGLSTGEASEQGIGSGVQRASDLANGENISLSTIRRMRAFFERHERNNRPDEREEDGGPTAGTIAWLLWGGTPGRRWANSVLEREGELDKSLNADLVKVDEQLGIVFGYAIVCAIDGEPYYDTQGDFIPERAMLEATAEFMTGDRAALDMHQGAPVGQVVFGFPVTDDIAKALGMQASRTGFVVGMKPNSDSLLARFASGEYRGFSIGGKRVAETVIDDD